MLIREARKEDAPAIASFIVMAESEMMHLFFGTDDAGQSAAAVTEFILSPTPNRYSLENNLVAEIDGQTAGSIICFPADSQPGLDTLLVGALNRNGIRLDRLFFEGEPGTFYLSTMGVNPDFRGRGIGTALLAAAEAKGAKLGFEAVSLLVSKDKGKAQALYERLGFKVVADVAIADVEYRRMTKRMAQ